MWLAMWIFYDILVSRDCAADVVASLRLQFELPSKIPMLGAVLAK